MRRSSVLLAVLVMALAQSVAAADLALTHAAHTGRLAPGMDADLVVLQADPARDVTAFARVRMTIRRGQLLYQAE